MLNLLCLHFCFTTLFLTATAVYWIYSILSDHIYMHWYHLHFIKNNNFRSLLKSKSFSLNDSPIFFLARNNTVLIQTERTCIIAHAISLNYFFS